MADGLDGELELEHGPGASLLRSIVASAMNFFSVGDQVLDVAFPTWPRPAVHGDRHARRRGGHLRRESDAVEEGLDGRPVDLEPHDRPGGAAPLLSRERRLSDEARLVEVNQPAEAHLERRVFLRLDQRLLAAREIDVDQQQPGLDPRDVEREHPRGPHVERLAARHQGVPHLSPRRPTGSRSRNRGRPCSRSARSRRGRRRSCPRVTRKYLSFSMSASATRFAAAARGRPLEGERRDLLGDVLDLDLHPDRVLAEPAQRRVRGRPAVDVLLEARDGPVVDGLAVLVAPGRVDDLPDGDLPEVARDDPVDEPRRVAPGEPVLVQGRDVDQRRGVADRVVLVLVVRLVRGDGVVARPLAVAQALAERERLLVDRGSDRQTSPRWSAARII